VKRRQFIAGLGGAMAARAQQPALVRRIGVLVPTPVYEQAMQPMIAELRDGLKNLGWIEGHNLRLEIRYAADPKGRAQIGRETALAHLHNGRRQPSLRDHPHRREDNAIHYVEQHCDASVERPRESHRIFALRNNNTRAKRAMGRPGPGPIMRPTIRWVDSSADRGMPSGEGFINSGLSPEDKWRTEKPAYSPKFNAQLRFALNRAQHGFPRGLLLNLGQIVDRERKMWSIAESAHRRLVLEGGNLVPQLFDLARGDIIGPNVDC
jgi:hypothetical protein